MLIRSVIALLALATAAGAQVAPAARVSSGEGFDFSIRNIMRGPELYGRPPEDVRWSADARWIHFRWNASGTPWRDSLRHYRVESRAGARPQLLTTAQFDSLSPTIADGPRSPNGRSRAVEANGDLWIVSLRDGATVRLTQTVAAESRPTWSADGGTIYFTRENNAYSLSLGNGATRQLTDVRVGPAPIDSARAVGQRGRLEQQQLELFDVIRDRSALDSIARAERKAREAAGLQPIYLAATERVVSIDVSPNGRAALLVVGQRAADQKQAEVPQF
ncbi:MAG: DPP IV N-terminal domain-containing protein, partial [Gemmatimonadaceae bacterium]|nr:DPP IV N-terminal domain-containing protein [Gemmatimonadaceae bacterium]